MITENSLRLLTENNGIADAKQKLLANDIKKKEDEMQGPGVAADKNAYNIFHKQLSNIHSAILVAKRIKEKYNEL